MPELRPTLPRGVWRDLRADPVRAPERIALAAAEHHAPGAARWVADRHAAGERDPHTLVLAAKRRHAGWSRWEGAAMGVGGVLAAAADVAALAWIQSRMVFHIAAAAGFDPHDPMRPAELLHLQKLYDTPEAAREALDGTGNHLAVALVLRGRKAEQELLLRLMRMAGRRAVQRFGARAIPLVASPINAVVNERETRRLADRAIAFYEVR